MDFAAGVYLSEAQNPIPPPLHTVHVYVDTVYSDREGGRGVEPEVEGQQFTKLS
jgi:hypothetical protein